MPFGVPWRRGMKKGHLSQYFSGIAAKRLSSVEANVLVSNQHEFNGVEGLRDLLGEPAGKVVYEATLLYLADGMDIPVSEEGRLTWYDARQKARLERGVQRWEYRLYFPSTRISGLAQEGDLLVIGLQPDGRLLVIIAADDSSAARQISWLFGLGNAGLRGFIIREDLDGEQDRIALTSRLILENIGIAVEAPTLDYLALIRERFGTRFPPTREFSAFARSFHSDPDVTGDPDGTLMTWMETEELLFRTLERHIIGEQLVKGFQASDGAVSVDGFLQFSLSVQNRRKSRVGLAFENHLEVIFERCGLRFDRTAVTENRARPDFLFPGSAAYHDPASDAEQLTVLGVKSTCKDRWRQVLAEADRVPRKHLLTLETAISRQQTTEMQEKGLQLVVPRALHETYYPDQRGWLMDLKQFVALVQEREETFPAH
jgi:hypothetical protein